VGDGKMLDKINYDFDIDKEKVYYAVPKRKSEYPLKRPHSVITRISRRVLEKYVLKLNRSTVVPDGKPIHIDDLLLEMQKFRDKMYKLAFKKFFGRRVLIPSPFNTYEFDYDDEMRNGFVEDFSFEDGMLDNSIGNVQIESDMGKCVFDFPLDAKHRREIESEISLESQRWYRYAYKDELEQADKKKEKSIHLKLCDVDLKKEDQLEHYLITRLYLIEDGMGYIGNQIEIQGGIIDILARDKNGKLCIIEIKTRSNAKDIIWQCMYYPTQFKDEEGMRVITIAPDYHYSIRTVLEKIPYVESKIFKVKDDKLIIVNG
jgi:hypothetical protein